MHWLLHEDRLLLMKLLLLGVDLLLLVDLLLVDVDIFFNMLMHNIAPAKTVLNVAMAKSMLTSESSAQDTSAYYTTVLSCFLFLFLEQLGMLFLFFAMGFFLCRF